MKNLIFWIKNKYKSFLYSFFLFCAFELIVKIYKEFMPEEQYRFFLIAGIFGFILLGLLFYGLLFIRKRYTDSEVKQVIVPLIRIHILHQLIFPMLLYWGMVGFIFFYPYDVITHVIIFVVSCVYWLLFVNIQAVFNRDFSLETFTHGIYNLVEIFVFFLIIIVNLEIFHYMGTHYFFMGILSFVISFLLITLALFRYMQTNLSSFLVNFFFSLVIGLFAWFVGRFIFSSYFYIGLYLTILFYLLSSIVHHKAEGTLTFAVFIEYFSVAFLSMIILSAKF